MRREIQSNINLNCQFFEHTDLTNKKDNEKARLDINLCNRRRKLGTAQGLRIASSFEESLAFELPPVRTKRYSLPASPIQAGCKEEELRVKSLKIDKPFPTPKVVTDSGQNRETMRLQIFFDGTRLLPQERLCTWTTNQNYLIDDTLHFII